MPHFERGHAKTVEPSHQLQLYENQKMSEGCSPRVSGATLRRRVPPSAPPTLSERGPAKGRWSKFRAPRKGCPIGDFGSFHQGAKPQLLTPLTSAVNCMPTAGTLALPIWCSLTSLHRSPHRLFYASQCLTWSGPRGARSTGPFLRPCILRL